MGDNVKINHTETGWEVWTEFIYLRIVVSTFGHNNELSGVIKC
jgi:hypothetical protein